MTTRHKALLIGASDYDEPGIRSLPFVRDDLARLSAALTERGFHSAEVAESKRGITLNFVKDQVSRFLREAKRDDTLWILLSGHGQHYEGTDHLIPEDASFHVHPFASSCVPLDWGKELNETAALRVVFLIDACREGIEQDSMGPAGIEGWSRRKREAARDRKVAYVYACSPGQFALFVQEGETVRDGTDIGTSPGESFSLFSRAVCDVVTGLPHAMHLTEFEETVQQRIAELHTAYRKSRPLQLIRVRTDAEKSDFAVLPGPARDASEHPWVRVVAGHPAWERTDPELCAARDALKELCVAQAGRLVEAYERSAASLRDDPWHDSELAKRTHDRMGFLLGKMGRGAWLSPTEAALLTLLPLVAQASRVQEAARRLASASPDGAPAPDATGGGLAHLYPRLYRRLRAIERSETGEGPAITWWLFHRWLTRQPDAYTPETFQELLGPLPGAPISPGWLVEALAHERFARLVKDQRTAPFTAFRPSQLIDSDPIGPSTGDEHHVREPLVACLVKAAHALAVDPLALPEVVPEHLGISDSVDLGELHATLRASNWFPSGTGRTLNASCQHPAVEIALHDHAVSVDSLLRDINQHASAAGHVLGPLASLPPYAKADRVRVSGKTPANLSAGIRFHLAEDRVQELLMGEALYGDRGLAVRELVQNAIDACRYREARTTYLRRTGHGLPDWEGLIEFVQGVDESGRPYLECRDNGIGMSVNDLSRAFAQVGTRFVHLPEYIEERLAWAKLDPPIELYPNSRFGIGVLSYFMLADEVTIHTCRFDRQGRPEHQLKVTIAGPGNLFRIEDLGSGQAAGTTIRLHLTERTQQPSCVEELRKVLLVAPYRTRAVHDTRAREWPAGELYEEGLHDLMRYRLDPAPGRCVPTEAVDLWWCEGEGAVLSDGIWVQAFSKVPNGLIVNLRGAHQPELTADRKTMRSVDDDWLRTLIHKAIPDLVRSSPPVLTPQWLTRFSRKEPLLANEIIERACRTGAPWLMNGHPVPVSKTGLFPPDEILMPLVTGEYPDDARIAPEQYAIVRTLPGRILRWRLLALYDTGLADPVSAVARSGAATTHALPSDMTLLSETGGADLFDWQLSERDTRRAEHRPSATFADIAPLLRRIFRWRTARSEVDSDEVFSRLLDNTQSAGDIAGRFKALGYQPPWLGQAAAAGRDDRNLLRPIGRGNDWLPPGAKLPLAQIAYSAARTGRPVAEVTARLSNLGWGVPAKSASLPTVTDDDARWLISHLWDWHVVKVPFEAAHQLSAAQVAMASFRARLPIGKAQEILREQGFELMSTLDTSHEFDEVDAALLGHRVPGLHIGAPVSQRYLATAAQCTGRDTREIAGRLGAFGFALPRDLPEPSRLSPEDMEFVMTNERRLPLSAAGLVRLARAAGTSPRSMAERCVRVGWNIGVDPAVLEELSNEDGELTYLADIRRRVHQEHLYVAARCTGSSIDHIADTLKRWSLGTPSVSEEFRRDLEAEEILTDTLAGGRTGAPTPASKWQSRAVSLAAIACAAARARKTFREAALTATRIGLGHEAEDWFG